MDATERARLREYAELVREGGRAVIRVQTLDALLDTIERLERENVEQTKRIDYYVACFSHGKADDLRRTIERLERERDAWSEYAYHAESCVECAQSGWMQCFEGRRLREATGAQDSTAAQEGAGDA